MLSIPRILIVGGPTREYIDPVRYISNESTGEMAHQLVLAARKKKLRVTFVRGPVKNPDKIPGVKTIDVLSASDMNCAVKENIKMADILIMAAAVSDYTPKGAQKHKIKKNKSLTLTLVQTPDILKSLKKSKGKIYVGFALESQNVQKNAEKKLKEKKLDLIICNQIKKTQSPFGSGKKTFMLLEKGGEKSYYKDISKYRISSIILDRVQALWYSQGH